MKSHLILLVWRSALVNTSTVQSSAGFSDHSATLNIIAEGMPLLEALMIVTCSLHNCRVFGYHGGIQKLMALMKGEKPLAMRSFKDTEVKLPRPTTLENKTPAPVQITAEQTLREAYGHQEADIQLPKQEITDPTELANHCPQNCKEYEDRVRVAIAAFLKHCKETDGIPKGRAEDLLDTGKLNKRMPIVTEAGLAGHEEWQKQQVKQHGTTIILVVLPHHVLIAADSRLTSYTYEIQRRPQHLKICELSFSPPASGCFRGDVGEGTQLLAHLEGMNGMYLIDSARHYLYRPVHQGYGALLGLKLPSLWNP